MTKLISNFTWTDEATNDWADIWDALWQLGFQWEWKVGDGYVRRYGIRLLTITLFTICILRLRRKVRYHSRRFMF